jgi:nucleotidyltransferase substrate binding protein (TIGR01987 family)
MTTSAAEQRHALTRALDRLGEALARDAVAEPLVLDAAIQRFEFSIELFWRVLQAALLAEGITVGSPRAALRAAYAQEWLAEEKVWLAMVQDRNRTSHTYREDLAGEIFARLPAYLAAMRAALAQVPTD